MSRVWIRARTKICIRRMYIIEPIGEMVYEVYESSRSKVMLLYLGCPFISKNKTFILKVLYIQQNLLVERK